MGERLDNPPLPSTAFHPKIDYMYQLVDIIAQETGEGRLIVRFLISAMDGQLPDFQPCHRIDAARLLVKLGFDQAQTVIDHAAAQRAANRNSRSQRQPQPQPESVNAARQVRDQLAQIVREETDDGRAAVQFLVNVMQGELPEFKPCHRLSAAKELLQRGFDYAPDADDPAAAEPEPTPEELEAQRRRAEDIEFSRHGWVYYESYPYPCVCEDRLHDCKGNVLDPRTTRQSSSAKGPGATSVSSANPTKSTTTSPATPSTSPDGTPSIPRTPSTSTASTGSTETGNTSTPQIRSARTDLSSAPPSAAPDPARPQRSIIATLPASCRRRPGTLVYPPSIGRTAGGFCHGHGNGTQDQGPRTPGHRRRTQPPRGRRGAV